jgi:hypothetical protein
MPEGGAPVLRRWPRWPVGYSTYRGRPHQVAVSLLTVGNAQRCSRRPPSSFLLEFDSTTPIGFGQSASMNRPLKA